jgi:hypothetical protein
LDLPEPPADVVHLVLSEKPYVLYVESIGPVAMIIPSP